MPYYDGYDGPRDYDDRRYDDRRHDPRRRHYGSGSLIDDLFESLAPMLLGAAAIGGGLFAIASLADNYLGTDFTGSLSDWFGGIFGSGGGDSTPPDVSPPPPPEAPPAP